MVCGSYSYFIMFYRILESYEFRIDICNMKCDYYFVLNLLGAILECFIIRRKKKNVETELLHCCFPLMFFHKGVTPTFSCIRNHANFQFKKTGFCKLYTCVLHIPELIQINKSRTYTLSKTTVSFKHLKIH